MLSAAEDFENYSYSAVEVRGLGTVQELNAAYERRGWACPISGDATALAPAAPRNPLAAAVFDA